jgi:hypothetical protein
MGTKNLSHIKPPHMQAVAWIGCCLLLICWALPAQAQNPLEFQFAPKEKPARPQFRTWNIGLVEGVSPLNYGTGLPTIRGHFRNFSVEVSPYPACAGLEATYHLPVWTLFKKLHWNVDASLFGARQNGLYWITFPLDRHLKNQNSLGLLVGPAVYFLKRCNVQMKMGANWISQYGEQQYGVGPFAKNTLAAQGSLSLEVRLFNNFAQ